MYIGLGMKLFIASEAIFFILLILAYLLFNSLPMSGPTASQVLNPVVSGMFSLSLLLSSAAVWGASRSARQGRPGRLQLWLAVTIVLGTVFLYGESLEWAGLTARGVTISRNLFGSTYYTLTGFHGLHVIAGLLLLCILLVLGFRGEFRGGRSAAAVGAVSIFWQFVIVVWIATYLAIYVRMWVR